MPPETLPSVPVVSDGPMGIRVPFSSFSEIPHSFLRWSKYCSNVPNFFTPPSLPTLVMHPLEKRDPTTSKQILKQRQGTGYRRPVHPRGVQEVCPRVIAQNYATPKSLKGLPVRVAFIPRRYLEMSGAYIWQHAMEQRHGGDSWGSGGSQHGACTLGGCPSIRTCYFKKLIILGKTKASLLGSENSSKPWAPSRADCFALCTIQQR